MSAVHTLSGRTEPGFRLPPFVATDGSAKVAKSRRSWHTGWGWVHTDGTWALGRMLLPVLQVGRSGSVVAELRAIAEAVRHRIPEQGVVVRSDCDQAMAFLDRWAAGDMALPTGYQCTANDVWRLDRWARRVARYHTSMAWDHVQGHSGHLMNEAADSLAQLGRRWCDGTYDKAEVTARATRLIEGFFRDSRLAQVA